jgi:hypothetical protein
MTKVTATQVAVLRGEEGREEWRVFVQLNDNGWEITTPVFNCKGAASAYCNLLQTGYRKPELQ